jgi:hypothetical protein
MAKSIRQQIADAVTKRDALNVIIAGLEAKVDSEVNTDEVQAGRTITFNYGKGETKKVLTGVVLGRKNAEPGTKGGDLVKVAVGEGFDALIVTIYPAQVTAIEAVAQAEAPAAE